jgi:type IV secretory pathway VirB9-like protein
MKYSAAFVLAALVSSGCATEPPTYPSDLEYRYVPLEKGPPPVADRPAPMPLLAGSHPGDGPVAKEAVVKPRSNARALQAALKASATNPVDCDFENSIMVCPYQKGRVYNVFVKAGNLASPSVDRDGNVVEAKADSEGALLAGSRTDTPGKPTLVMLQPGESVVNVGFDDYSWFEIPEDEAQESGVDKTSKYGGGEGRQAIIPVRGWKAGACTGLWILTDRRTYMLNVCANRRDYNRAVAWHYPGNGEIPDNVFNLSSADGDGVGAGAGSLGAVDPARLKRYDVSGSAEWLPEKWEAFHDGETLHLIPPAELVSRPVPFVRREGSEGRTRWDLASDGHYRIYGRPSEVFLHEGNKDKSVVFRARN